MYKCFIHLYRVIMVICKDFTQKFPTVEVPFMSHWKDYILLPWHSEKFNLLIFNTSLISELLRLQEKHHQTAKQQARKVSSHVYCQQYQLYIFLRFFYWILNCLNSVVFFAFSFIMLSCLALIVGQHDGKYMINIRNEQELVIQQSQGFSIFIDYQYRCPYNGRKAIIGDNCFINR